MSRLVDPHICPDCRAPLDAEARCTGCGLVLAGPAAAELWQRMQEADRLVEQLRAASLVTASGPGGAALPVAPSPAPAAARTRALPSASVPVVLLALGGLCLLVAAIVFVAVAWSSLGLAAKTLILLSVTALFAAAAVAVTRRELRFAAETLWLVVAGLVAVDLGAAYGSDLLGLSRLGDRGAVALVGAALLGLAVGVGAWATGTALGPIRGLVGVAAVGTVLLAGAEAWTQEGPLAVAVSVPALALLAWSIDRLTESHLRTTAYVVAGAAVVSWLVLAGHGVDRMSTTPTDRAWWTDLAGWPLLVAAALAAVVALPARVPTWGRSVAAGGCLVTLALFGVGPSTGPTADLLAWAAVSALVAAVAASAPLVWSRPAAALASIGLLVWSLLALGRPLGVIADLPASARPDRADLDLVVASGPGGPSAWTAVVVVFVVGALAAALLRHLPDAGLRESAGRALIALGPGALGLGAATTLLELEPTLLVAVLAWSVALALAASMAVSARQHDASLIAVLALAAYLAATGLRLALPSHLLTGAVATALALALALAHARARRDRLAGVLLPLLATSATLAAGVAATQWPYLAGGRGDAAGVALALVAGTVLVLARPLGRGESSRRATEVTALVLGLAATGLPPDETVVAAVLTVVGSAVALVAVLNEDRESAGWLTLPVLGAATALRVVEDVRLPELSTLPAAALLIAAGWWRLARDPGPSSVRVLGSGLTLALAPSLLLALDEPVSLRGALVAAGGLAALAVGVAKSWTAPFVAGATTTAVLAVRHLGPVVDAVPRWISLGSAGVILLAVGITWEQRRRDVAAAGHYLASLR